MVKQLQFKLMLLLCALVVGTSSVWAEKITDYANIVSGTRYYIGATTGGTDYYLSVDGSSTSDSRAGTAVTSKANATVFIFAGSGTSWTIQFDDEYGYYLSLNSSKDNGKVQVVQNSATFTASNQSSKIRLTIGSYSIQKNNSGTQFGSYGNTQTDVWLEVVPPVYTITAQSNNTNYGTVSLSGNVITGSPAEGYRYASPAYTVSPAGSATVAQSGNNFTVTASANTTVTINFEQIPSHTLLSAVSPDNAGTVTLGSATVIEGTTTTVTAVANAGYKFSYWSISGTGASLSSTSTNPTTVTMGTADATITANFEAVNTHAITYSVNGNTNTVNVEEGTAIDLSAPASGVPAGYVFRGWRTATLALTDTDPDDYVTSATSTANTTYYAVMAVVSASTPASWTETALGNLTSSDVFVFSNGTYAMNNDGGTSDQPTANSITVSEGKITSTVAEKLKWNVSGNATDGYTFYPNGTTETWLYCNTTGSSGSNNNIRVGTGNRKVWKLNSNNYLVTNDTYTDRYLSIYNNSDFRGYTSTSNGAFVPKFYKYVAPVNTYANYCTTVPTATITLASACNDGEGNYYGTYSNSQAFVVPEGLTVSEINVANETLTITNYETGDIVPANTGVLVSASSAGDKTVMLTAGGTSVLGNDNKLKGTGNAAITSSDMSNAAPNCQYYRLTMHDADPDNNIPGTIGFWWGADNGGAFAVAANKAYLAVPTSVGARLTGFSLFGGDATIVKELKNSRIEDLKSVYDLQGRRVQSSKFFAEQSGKAERKDQSSKLKPGLYIKDGKKVFMK